MTSFATTEGLRDLLIRMHEMESVGHFAWRLDPETERLMRYTIRKYRPLAHRHHCEPEDAAYAAFEAMRSNAVRSAHDPWAVVTRAVQVSLIAEERANDLLCSPGQARRTHIMWHHDARRFSEYELDLVEYDPIFWISPEQDQIGADEPAELEPGERPPTTAGEAVNKTISLFTKLGWPESTITCALDYIASRLIEAGDPRLAYDYLRRDFTGLAFLDVRRTRPLQAVRHRLHRQRAADRRRPRVGDQQHRTQDGPQDQPCLTIPTPAPAADRNGAEATSSSNVASTPSSSASGIARNSATSKLSLAPSKRSACSNRSQSRPKVSSCVACDVSRPYAGSAGPP